MRSEHIIKQFIIPFASLHVSKRWRSFDTWGSRVRAKLLLVFHLFFTPQTVNNQSDGQWSRDQSTALTDSYGWEKEAGGGWAEIISNYYLLKSHNNWDLWKPKSAFAFQLKCALAIIGLSTKGIGIWNAQTTLLVLAAVKQPLNSSPQQSFFNKLLISTWPARLIIRNYFHNQSKVFISVLRGRRMFFFHFSRRHCAGLCARLRTDSSVPSRKAINGSNCC